MNQTNIIRHNGIAFHYNSSIWPEEMAEPAMSFPGIDGTTIGVNEIPFKYKTLFPGDRIQNSHGERLQLVNDSEGYRLVTNEANAYLVHWFDVWEKI